MTQPSEPVHDEPMDNRLSSLPAELQLHISEYLNYSDLCSVRGTSQALSRCFADPATRLADEVSKAWIEIGSKFRDRYYVDTKVSLLGMDSNGKSIVREVEEHAIGCGFSKTVVQWLAHPSRYHFSCCKCRVVKPWMDFPTHSLRRTHPFRLFAEPLVKQRDYKEILGSMMCGACIAAAQPYTYHSLGLRHIKTSIIQCHRCFTIKRTSDDLSFRLRFSGFCQQCFAEVNKNWFKYKIFLQDCLTTMEAYENGEEVESLSWEGLPECPVPADYVAALNNKHHRPLPSHAQIICAQLSFRAARLGYTRPR